MVTPDASAHFVSCDWGSSRLRLRLVERSRNEAVAEHLTDQGIQSIAAAHPDRNARPTVLGQVLESGLAALGVAARSDVPVVISGMASSTLGWHSLPYASLPAPIDGRTLRFHDFKLSGRQVRLVSGLQSASDVMRGEETELVGLLGDPARRALAEDSLVVLPGTHSKHVRLRGGQIVDFATYLTGELFALLARNSTLDLPENAPFDSSAFIRGVRVSRERGLSAALFQTRARTVLGLMPATHSRAFLSGVLIGAEIEALPDSPAGAVVLAANEALTEPYALALAELRPTAAVTRIAPDELANATIRGHARILAHP